MLRILFVATAAAAITLHAVAPASLHHQFAVGAVSALVASRAASEPDSASARLVGTWQGQFQVENGDPGDLTLIVTHASEWKLAIDMSFGGQAMNSAVSDVKVDGAKITWTQTAMGNICRGSAVLAGDALRGETDCGHASIGYILKRKAN